MRPSNTSRKQGSLRHRQMALRSQPWLLNVVLSPADSVLDAIQIDGTLLSIGDMAICNVPYHGKIYAAVPALQCVAQVFDVARVRDPDCPSTTPLHCVAAKLERNALLEPDDLTTARMCLAQLRIYAGRMTIEQMRSLLKTAAIKFEMEVDAQSESA